MLCSEPSCDRFGINGCHECGQYFCKIHCSSYRARASTARARTPITCNAVDNSSLLEQKCDKCDRYFCNDHVRYASYSNQCAYCMDPWTWSQFEQKGTCETDGCRELGERECSKCGKRLCGEHANCYDSGFLSTSFRCDGYKDRFDATMYVVDATRHTVLPSA